MAQITLTINKNSYELEAEPNETLLRVLRERLRLTGTKCGCNTGDCGACKVIVDGKAVNACLLRAVKLEGVDIVTVEGVSGCQELHPIQQALIEAGAVQCGFCIPGMVISAKALLDKNPAPTRAEIVSAIDNNLCRCTGYVKIIEGIQLASKRMQAGTGGV